LDERVPRGFHLEETDEEKRLRRAACLLSDIAWRAHPDYRAEQSHDMISNATFIGIDHPARAYLALAASYRHVASEVEIAQYRGRWCLRANSIARGFSAARCGSRISFRRRCQACCRGPRCPHGRARWS